MGEGPALRDRSRVTGPLRRAGEHRRNQPAPASTRKSRHRYRVPMNQRARRERALLRNRRRGLAPTFHEAPIIGPLTGYDLWITSRMYGMLNGELPSPVVDDAAQVMRLKAVGEPFRGQLSRALWGSFRGQWRVGADGQCEGQCRLMETRTCPPAGPCEGPCARFESDDPTPWL